METADGMSLVLQNADTHFGSWETNTHGVLFGRTWIEQLTLHTPVIILTIARTTLSAMSSDHQ